MFFSRWTGSNTNPHNNDGQGRAGTDRSNVILQRLQVYPEGTPGGDTAPGVKFGHWGRSYPEMVYNTTFLGLSQKDLMDLALLTSRKSKYIKITEFSGNLENRNGHEPGK